jgi:radical SAM superfamily enzyme YgiQ (UPF0313 family)
LDGRYKRLFIMPSMTMPYIAALTPRKHEVTIIDETLGETVDYDADPDLVGITCITPMARKVYRVASRFQRRGVPVVIGGCHPTILPDEAKTYCDAVVVGDGEKTWPALLEDFGNKRLRPFYKGDPDGPLENLPAPRMDLMRRRSRYQFFGVHAAQIKLSRGCPNKCTVCPIPTIYKGRFRYRPLDDVIREIENTNDKYIYFNEDNITGDMSYARELFKRMIPLRKKWTSVGGIRFAEGDMPELARKSGCMEIFLGLETPNVGSLKDMKKSDNLRVNLYDAVKKIHDAGILITGGFLVGFDSDDGDSFKRILDFVFEANIEMCQYLLLLPIPRTPIYRALETQGRLLRPKWWLEDYYSNKVVFKPKRLTPEQLARGLVHLTRETYKISTIAKKLIGKSIFTSPRVGPAQRFGALGFNMAFREMYWQQLKLYEEKLGWNGGQR